MDKAFHPTQVVLLQLFYSSRIAPGSSTARHDGTTPTLGKGQSVARSLPRNGRVMIRDNPAMLSGFCCESHNLRGRFSLQGVFGNNAERSNQEGC